MKKIILPLLALIMLLSGGAGAYFYFNGAASEASTGDAPAHAAKKADGDTAPKTAYISMEPIILPIIDRDGISQTISMVISLEVSDEGKLAEIQDKLPKLADAYLSDMYGTLSKKASMEHGVIKVSQLKARLMVITNRIMGPDAVNSVLLQVLQQHPV